MDRQNGIPDMCMHYSGTELELPVLHPQEFQNGTPAYVYKTGSAKLGCVTWLNILSLRIGSSPVWWWNYGNDVSNRLNSLSSAEISAIQRMQTVSPLVMDVSARNFLCGVEYAGMYLLPVALRCSPPVVLISLMMNMKNSKHISLIVPSLWHGISPAIKSCPYRTASSVGVVYVNNDTVVIDGDTLGFSSDNSTQVKSSGGRLYRNPVWTGPYAE